VNTTVASLLCRVLILICFVTVFVTVFVHMIFLTMRVRVFYVGVVTAHASEHTK
jgi:hypothetical protein